MIWCPNQQRKDGSLVRVRQVVIRQRNQIIDAVRSHLTDFGHSALQEPSNVQKQLRTGEDPSYGRPSDAAPTLHVHTHFVGHVESESVKPDAWTACRPKVNDLTRWLRPIPGTGQLIAPAFCNTGASWRDLPQGAACRSLAGADAPITLNGWQTTAWSDNDDGRKTTAMRADHWREQRNRQTKVLARPQAKYAGATLKCLESCWICWPAVASARPRPQPWRL